MRNPSTYASMQLHTVLMRDAASDASCDNNDAPGDAFVVVDDVLAELDDDAVGLVGVFPA